MKSLKLFFVLILYFSNGYLLAQESVGTNTVDFPLLDDAQIFYQSNDIEPKIVIYYTQSTFPQVTSFYTQRFGTPVSEQTIYGRLELSFTDNDRKIRVIVDQQDNAREVDVMIE